MAGTTASRVGSIAIGVVLGIALMALFYRAARSQDEVEPAGRVVYRCELAIDGEPVRATPALAGFAGDLGIGPAGGRSEALEWQESGATGQALVGQFGDGEFESRTLVIALAGDRALGVQAEFAADVGSGFLGEVHVDGSSVCKRGDVLDLDLAVERLDGSAQVERWRCQVKLR